MKIQKMFVAVATLVTCAIAAPYTVPFHSSWIAFNSNNVFTSIGLFLTGFLLMVCAGWVKKVQR